MADLNRVGGFNVFSGGQSIPWQELWPEGLVEGGIADLLDRMSRACSFSIPAQLPPTGPETLVYRVMAGVSAALVFEKVDSHTMVCVSKTSLCWDIGGGEINLAALYRQDRRIHCLVGTVWKR